MDNKQQIKRLGVGAMFPIILQETPKDNEETPSTMGWYPLQGNMDLVKQSITSILSFELGQRFRQERFGITAWSAIEEPNTLLLRYQIRNQLIQAIETFEPRVSIVSVDPRIKDYGLSISLSFYVNNLSSEGVQDMEYIYAY